MPPWKAVVPVLEEGAGGGEGLLTPVGAWDGVGDIGPTDPDSVDVTVEVAAEPAPVGVVAGCVADPGTDDAVWEAPLAMALARAREGIIISMEQADSMWRENANYCQRTAA